MCKCGRKANHGEICSTCYQLNRYGYCKNTHQRAKKRVADSPQGLCFDCRKKADAAKCSVEDCDKKAHRKNMCLRHYQYSRYGKCINSCDRPACGKDGYCADCYKRGGRESPAIRPGVRLNTGADKYCWRCLSVLDRSMFSDHSSMCKKCSSEYRNSRGIRAAALEFGIKNVVQTKLWVCVKCWESLTRYHVDHIIPKSLGGTDAINNLQIMCRRCNLSKNNREDVDYRIFLPGVLV